LNIEEAGEGSAEGVGGELSQDLLWSTCCTGATSRPQQVFDVFRCYPCLATRSVGVPNADYRVRRILYFDLNRHIAHNSLCVSAEIT
jgi:hypothetical protein